MFIYRTFDYQQSTIALNRTFDYRTVDSRTNGVFDYRTPACLYYGHFVRCTVFDWMSLTFLLFMILSARANIGRLKIFSPFVNTFAVRFTTSFKTCLSLVFTSDASTSASTITITQKGQSIKSIKIIKMQCACAFACIEVVLR